MNKKIFCGVLFLFMVAFNGCKDSLASEKIYLARSGGQATDSNHYETGVFVSPNGALVPYLIEDNRDTGTLAEIESLLNQLGFTLNWIQSVKNNLNKNGSAFVFYTNTSNYYRWIWITEK